jgi:hypothetical protein
MSGIITDNLGRATGLIKSAGGGAILKRATLQYTGTATHTGTAPAAMTEFNLSFQPTTATGKLWLEASINHGTDTADQAAFYFYNSTDTEIAGPVGDAAGSRLRVQWKGDNNGSHVSNNWNFGCWYEPASTASKDYQIWGNGDSSQTLYINRGDDDANTAVIRMARAVSFFSITEYDGSIVTIS